MISRNTSESQRAIQKCHNKCIICGWDNKNPLGKSMVEGCHLYNFSKEKKFDKFNNIIALCPNHHTEMDNDCFYIDAQDHTLHFFDSSNELNGLTLEISYINNDYLAHRQYLTLRKWEKLRNSISK